MLRENKYITAKDIEVLQILKSSISNNEVKLTCIGLWNDPYFIDKNLFS